MTKDKIFLISSQHTGQNNLSHRHREENLAVQGGTRNISARIEGNLDLVENGSFLLKVQPGVLKIAGRLPPPPPLDVLRGCQVRETVEHRGYSCSETMTGDLVPGLV